MVRSLLIEAQDFGIHRGPLFVFNTTLAFVPLAIGYCTFRRDRRPTAGWWIGLALFLLFLPNAAYVLTDAVHLLRDIRSEQSDVVLATIHLPAWAAFILTGFTFYVLALRRLEQNVRSVWPHLPWWPAWFVLQSVVAVGIYLGRVTRLHSWHVVTHPAWVADGLHGMLRPAPLAFVAFTTGVLCLGCLAWRPVVDSGSATVRRYVRHAVARWDDE